MSLSGKVAIVTGGATGIGFATAKVLAERGARVVIAQRDASRGRDAVERLKPAEVLTCELDIRDRASVERCVDSVADRSGGIDILVNNAGVTGRSALAPFLASSADLVDRIVDTNLKGTVYCSQAVARHMVKAKREGSIIHVSSVGAYAAQENASVYCATKAAQVMLTRGMAIELAPYGIRVNGIAPGDIQTETSAEAVRDIHESGASGRFLRFTPMGRRGCAEDVGHAVAFLVSAEATFITGTTLLVDGGFLAY
ncbi:MAG TPA: SDR family NAD(P)-dependent oxidoreductase [Candidatus Limnocylindria bacterium]|jgi:NAD(P)-dependent dehydrogenase (short-subunit alcohol dehydrogenase family)|nr:SDR family NAD(P)-dependent oxidoreductase [Candidatus Limnocylindria bacterium]